MNHVDPQSHHTRHGKIHQFQLRSTSSITVGVSDNLSLIANMKTKKYLSTKEAAELLSVDPRTILHRIQRNEIIAHKSGKTWKIEYDSIKDQEEHVSER